MSEGEGGGRAGALAALVIALALIGLSLWVAQGLIAMVKQQNCVMSGRRDCLQMPAE